MPQVISNRTSVSQGVGIKTADGASSTVHLQPKPSHVTLSAGSKVDPYWLATHPNTINIFEKADPKPAPLPVAVTTEVAAPVAEEAAPEVLETAEAPAAAAAPEATPTSK